MTRLLLPLLLLAPWSWGVDKAAKAHVDIARGVELAAKGDLKEAALLNRLERIFSSSSDPTTRLTVANLLTYSPASRGLRDRFVEFVLEQPESESILGRKELVRAHRLRGERLYEAGNFQKAREDFLVLLESGEKKSAVSSDPQLRDFAVLKVGWCDMNSGHPERAWALWIEEAERRAGYTQRGSQQGSERGERQGLYQNFSHSLGQSLVENLKRSEGDVRRFGAAIAAGEERSAAIRGLMQGMDAIDSAQQMKRFAAQVSTIDWQGEIQQKVLEQSGGTGQRSCLYTSWLEWVGQESPVFADAVSLAERCTLWLRDIGEGASKKVVSKKKDAKQVEIIQQSKNDLKRWVAEQKWNQEQLKFPFTYYQVMGQSADACSVGLTWLTLPPGQRARKGAPVKAIAEECAVAMDRTENVEEWRGFFLPSETTESYFRDPKDPLLYVALALLEKPKFQKSLVQSILANPTAFSGTLIPVLALEKLEKEKSESSTKLWAGLAGKQADDAQQSSVWRDILQRRYRELETAQDRSAIYGLLEAHLRAPGDPQLSEFGYGLWLKYLTSEVEQARKASENKLLEMPPGKSRSVAEALLTESRLKQYSKFEAASLEMMGWFGLWDRLWAGLSATPSEESKPKRGKKAAPPHALSETMELQLLSALISKRLRVGEVPTQPTLQFLVDLGNQLESASDEWLLALHPTGRGAISKDALFLKANAEKQKKLLAPRRPGQASAKQALEWIRHIDGKRREMSKRTWTHVEFFHCGARSVSQFCKSAIERLPELKNRVGGAGSSSQEWESFFSEFEKKLKQCGEKSVQKASL